jgi:hypothetical protein
MKGDGGGVGYGVAQTCVHIKPTLQNDTEDHTYNFIMAYYLHLCHLSSVNSSKDTLSLSMLGKHPLYT